MRTRRRFTPEFGVQGVFEYRWESGETTDERAAPQLRVAWENHNLTDESVSLVVALTDGFIRSDWQLCTVAYGFEEATRTPDEVAESECYLSILANQLPKGGRI